MQETFKGCSYCGQKSNPELVCCKYCGAPLPEYPWQTWRTEPYFYNGYVVWGLKENSFMLDRVSYYFYLGERLIDVVMVDTDVIRKFVPEYCDFMGFIFDLFKLSQGKEEVIRVVEVNSIKPATFEIHRLDLSEYAGLSLGQFYEAYGQR